VADTLAGDQRIEALELLNAILGAGRDALARTYVALASGADSPLREHPAVPQEGGEAGTGDGSVPAGAIGFARWRPRTEVLGRVGVITLGDEHRRNALSAELAQRYRRRPGELCEPRTCGRRASRRRGNARCGPRAVTFTELPRGRRDPLAYNDPLEELIRSIRVCPVPIIAMVHGSVWGGAFDLVTEL